MYVSALRGGSEFLASVSVLCINWAKILVFPSLTLPDIYAIVVLICTNLMLALLGRPDETLECVESYLKATKMFRDYSDPDNDPVFSEVRFGRPFQAGQHNHFETC